MAQTAERWQLAIVDDGSTDQSFALAKSFAEKDARIIVLSQKNKGTASARDLGYKTLECDYLAYLDADDELAPEYLDKMATLIAENPSHVLYACNILYKFPDKEYVAWDYSQVSVVSLQDWGVSPDISMAGSIIRKKDYYSLGGFTGYDSYVEDLYLLVRFLVSGNAVIAPDALYRYHRIHRHHKSSAKLKVWRSAIASLEHIKSTVSMTPEQERVISSRIELYRQYQREFLVESIKYGWHIVTKTVTMSKPYRILLGQAKRFLKK